jgi:hypothetical protein
MSMYLVRAIPFASQCLPFCASCVHILQSHDPLCLMSVSGSSDCAYRVCDLRLCYVGENFPPEDPKQPLQRQRSKSNGDDPKQQVAWNHRHYFLNAICSDSFSHKHAAFLMVVIGRSLHLIIFFLMPGPASEAYCSCFCIYKCVFV